MVREFTETEEREQLMARASIQGFDTEASLHTFQKAFLVAYQEVERKWEIRDRRCEIEGVVK